MPLPKVTGLILSQLFEVAGAAEYVSATGLRFPRFRASPLASPSGDPVAWPVFQGTGILGMNRVRLSESSFGRLGDRNPNVHQPVCQQRHG